jgi:hypothetical protein
MLRGRDRISKVASAGSISISDNNTSWRYTELSINLEKLPKQPQLSICDNEVAQLRVLRTSYSSIPPALSRKWTFRLGRLLASPFSGTRYPYRTCCWDAEMIQYSWCLHQQSEEGTTYFAWHWYHPRSQTSNASPNPFFCSSLLEGRFGPYSPSLNGLSRCVMSSTSAVLIMELAHCFFPV